MPNSLQILGKATGLRRILASMTDEDVRDLEPPIDRVASHCTLACTLPGPMDSVLCDIALVPPSDRQELRRVRVGAILARRLPGAVVRWARRAPAQGRAPQAQAPIPGRALCGVA